MYHLRKKQDLIALSLLLITFLFSPSVFYIITFLGVLFSEKNFEKALYAHVFSISSLAYQWIPAENFDLFRHHMSINIISYMPKENILSNIFSTQEPLKFLVLYIVSLTNNYNLLQFVMTFLILVLSLYPVIYYAKEYGMSSYSRNILYLFVYFNLPILLIISGIWNFFAIAYFSYILFLWKEEFIRNKFLLYLFLSLSILFHFGMTIAIVLFILYDFLKLNTNKKITISIIGIFILLFFVPTVSEFLYDFTSIQLFKIIGSRFSSYFINQSKFGYLNSFRVLILDVLKIITVFLLLKCHDKLESNDTSLDFRSDDFIRFFSTFIFLFGLYSRILLRFTFMMTLLMIPYIAKILKITEEQKKLNNIYLLTFKERKYTTSVGIYLGVQFVINIIYFYYSLINAKVL